MILTALLIAIGIAAGLARGGKIGNLAAVELRAPWLVFTGLAVQVAGDLASSFFVPSMSGGPAGITLLSLAYGLLIVFVVINFRLPGAAMIGVGLALNLAVILANGAMPVSQDAARASGVEHGQAGFMTAGIKHTALDDDAPLWFLADVIPLPIFRQVVSIGDVVLGVGIVLLVERLVRYRPRRLKGRTSALRSRGSAHPDVPEPPEG